MVLVIGSRIYGHSNQSGRKKKGGKDKEEVQVKSYGGAAAEFGVWRVLSEAHTKCAATKLGAQIAASLWCPSRVCFQPLNDYSSRGS